MTQSNLTVLYVPKADIYYTRLVAFKSQKIYVLYNILKAMMKAYSLRQLPKGLVFHSNRGSQCTSKHYRKLFANYGMRASMYDIGVCWDNAVVERFLSSLKHD
jgi:putative transposase